MRGEDVTRTAGATDHVRIVAGLFFGWAAVQVGGAAAVSFARAELQPRGGLLVTAWGLLLLLAAAYAVSGAFLWRHDRRARAPAIALAVLALLSIPVGTAIGAYALWVLLARARPVRRVHP